MASAESAELPTSIIDFDRQVSFSKPLFMSIFHGYNDDHIYYVLTNSVGVSKLSAGSPDLSLIYDKIKVGHRALLTIRGTTGFGPDYRTALDEIGAHDPAAKFVIPEPYSFSFGISTPGSDGTGATIDSAKIDSSGHFEILAKVADVTARILLLPNSYKFDSMAVVYSPVYHGIIRTEDGTPKLLERRYDVSFVSNGGCVFNPERYESWVTRHVGCVFPTYDRRLIFALQTKLKKLNLFDYRADGVYGPQTNAAIRRYQVGASLTPDGIPDAELAELIDKDVASRSAMAH
jgi:hypothetical protein